MFHITCRLKLKHPRVKITSHLIWWHFWWAGGHHLQWIHSRYWQLCVTSSEKCLETPHLYKHYIYPKCIFFISRATTQLHVSLYTKYILWLWSNELYTNKQSWALLMFAQSKWQSHSGIDSSFLSRHWFVCVVILKPYFVVNLEKDFWMA